MKTSTSNFGGWGDTIQSITLSKLLKSLKVFIIGFSLSGDVGVVSCGILKLSRTLWGSWAQKPFCVPVSCLQGIDFSLHDLP